MCLLLFYEVFFSFDNYVRSNDFIMVIVQYFDNDFVGQCIGQLGLFVSVFIYFFEYSIGKFLAGVFSMLV